jgi:hypothetical protein
VLCKIQFGKHSDFESRIVFGNLGIPTFAVFGYAGIVCKFEVLLLYSYQKSVVQSPLVDVRSVLHTPLLCVQGRAEAENQQKIYKNQTCHCFY